MAIHKTIVGFSNEDSKKRFHCEVIAAAKNPDLIDMDATKSEFFSKAQDSLANDETISVELFGRFDSINGNPVTFDFDESEFEIREDQYE